ncbi:hypothetical protein BG005_010819 [Podila minutissima]|nr:hypothetical protein BG005_010819 [Podila minutissima]
MPFLTLSNPRNRASLVVVLLLLELMTILWLRRSSSERAPVFPSSSQEQEPPYLLHKVIHQKKSKFSNPEGHYERIEVQAEELKERSGAKEDKPTPNEHGNGQNREPMAKTIPDQHHHHQPVPDTQKKIRKPDQTEPIPTIPMPSPNKVVAPSTTLTEDNRPKANKKTRTRKSKNAKKGKNSKPQKSILERKLGQLIPALDENGVVIEDHFISPRDSDGDGIPDYYVLLRPSTNRYMMDVGLFDEDAVAPPAPGVLFSVIIASQPTAIPIVDPVVPVSPLEAPPPAATPPPPSPPPPAPVA